MSRPLSIFVQVQPNESKGAVPFYKKLGFEQINDPQVNNGKAMIPHRLSSKLCPKTFIEEGECGMFLFHSFLDTTEETECNSPLPPQQNLVVPLDLLDNDDVKHDELGDTCGDCVWCYFPSPSKWPAMYFQGLLILKKGLPLLGKLLPPHEGGKILIPKMYDNIFNGSSPFIGNVLMRDRLRESQSKGTQWMTTGQLSAALALLIADGRYQEHVAIIDPSVMGRIQ